MIGFANMVHIHDKKGESAQGWKMVQHRFVWSTSRPVATFDIHDRLIIN